MLVVCLMTMACGRLLDAADEVIDRVIAVVAGDLIMQSDVNAVRVLGLPPLPQDASDEAIVNQLIDRILVLSEIERYSPPEPSASTISDGVTAIRNRFASRVAFDEALARVGFTERRLQQTVRQDLRIDAYVQQRFTAPAPTDAEVAAYFQAHQNEFSAGGRGVTMDDAREQVARAVTQHRREALVADWIAGLRRRASIMRVGITGG
jgi:hypothetical protein